MTFCGKACNKYTKEGKTYVSWYGYLLPTDSLSITHHSGTQVKLYMGFQDMDLSLMSRADRVVLVQDEDSTSCYVMDGPCPATDLEEYLSDHASDHVQIVGEYVRR